MMRQFPDKTNRICQKYLAAARQVQHTGRRVQRRKQCIFFQYPGTGQHIDSVDLPALV